MTETAVTERTTAGTAPARKQVQFGEAFRFWVRLGFINFGGPAGQIAMMHRELVDKKQWVSNRLFLRALNFCMVLPGPEAQQLAIYLGWKLHGYFGGIVAGSFFVIPSFFLLLLLSWLSVEASGVTAIAGLLYGIQPVVIAIVVDAVIRMGHRTLRHPLLLGFAAAAFVAIFFLHLTFPFVIGAAALGGLLLQRRYPHVFRPVRHGPGHSGGDGNRAHEAPVELLEREHPTLGRALRVVGAFLALWLAPLGALWLWRGWGDVLTQEMWFFTQAAFVTLGGAYAVLSYMSNMAVNSYHWLSGAEMVRGLGLAESTPGPLIIVTEYVGFLAAYKNAGPFPPLLYGTLGALVTVYATFLPPFLFVFLGAPHSERLWSNRRLQAALTGVTAAVVGVIANLAAFFGLRVLFTEGGGFDVFAAAVAAGSFLVLRRFNTPTYWLVPVGALAGMAWALAGGR